MTFATERKCHMKFLNTVRENAAIVGWPLTLLVLAPLEVSKRLGAKL